MKRFVVLDRDGTLIVERHYLADPAQVELLPGAVQGLRQIVDLGLGLAVVTNQSGVGRGYFDLQRLAEIHDRMVALLAIEGISLDGIYYCPHLPDDRCACRKPSTGMILQAAADLNFAPTDCFVIGDKPCDIELGQGVRATTLLVKTGYGAQVAANRETTPDYVVQDLAEAAQVIHTVLDGGVRIGDETKDAVACE
jgi:D-glycero-D-manno-heptose 1,7-bisphosphate phosphatase